jgi:hydrogenase expression/formation protein HypE
MSRPDVTPLIEVEPNAASRFVDAQIEMSHGAGGKATRRLIDDLIAPLLLGCNRPLDDAATVVFDGVPIVFTADSFVVQPLRFPGGSIGELAVNGTTNDLAVSGAVPKALVATFVLEAGLAGPVLAAEVRAMADACARAGVTIVGGDTKVVEHGKCDGMYITTAGIGTPDPRARLSIGTVRPGDQILLSGCIGDHGCTVLLARGQVDFETALRSDTRCVWPMIDRLLGAAGAGVRWMRDPTRGGVATTLNELARDTGLGVVIHEQQLPIRDEVRGICELLGLDPLHIANEGQFIAIVDPASADAAVHALRSAPGGEAAAIVGELRPAPAGVVIATSAHGGNRVIDMLVGDPLPRIC